MKKRYSTRKNRRYGRKSQHGGGPGAAYSVEGVLVPGLPYLVNNPISNCQATAPDYALKSVSEVGLPGMSGSGPLNGLAPAALTNMGKMSGGRRRKGRRSQRGGSKPTTGQRGGRYAVDPIPVGGMDSPNVAVTWGRIACENGAPPHISPTVPTQPGYNNLPGAYPPMKGGALQPPYSGSPVLEETTAGYTHLRSGSDAVVTQAGVPVMFNIPSGGRVGVPDACVRTHGGKRRSYRKRRSNRKRSNRNRK